MSLVLTPAAPPTSTIMKVINPLNTSVEATFEDSYHRKIGYPVAGKVKVAKGARLLSCVREAGLSVWRILKTKLEKKVGEHQIDLDTLDVDPLPGSWEKVLEMDLNVHSNIIGHEISDDGKWLAVSDLYETKLFSLHSEVRFYLPCFPTHLTNFLCFVQDNGQIKIKRIKEFASALRSHVPITTAHPHSTGSCSLCFSPDSSKLVISTALSSYIIIVDLTDDKPKVLRRFEHHRLKDGNGRALRGKLASSKPKVNGHAGINGDVMMGELENEDVPLVNGIDGSGEKSEMDEDHDDDSSDDDDVAIVSIDRSAISSDGQWLATSDSHARTYIFNLDSITVRPILQSYFYLSFTSYPVPYNPSDLSQTSSSPCFRPYASLRLAPRLSR